MKIIYYKKTAISLALSVLSVAAIAQDKPKLQPKPQQKETLDNIIVIGEKTERSLKDTSSSVSVVTAESLQSLQHLSVREAISNIPNIITLTGAVPDVRGVSGNGSAGGFNSISGGARERVATLIDGVAEPFVADRTGDFGVWDLQQIEVYRGPQSTTNGRNSIGGLIFIKTNDPTFEQNGAVRVGYRNQESYLDTSVMFNTPLVQDRLALRVTSQRIVGETITDDNEFETNPADYDLNEIETQRHRIKLLLTPNENFSALLSYTHNNEQGDSGRRFYEADRIDEYRRIFFRDIETNSDTLSLKLDYTFSDSVSLDVLASYADYQWGFDSYEADPAAEQQLEFDEQNYSIDGKLNFGSSDANINGFIGVALYQRNQDFVSANAFDYNGDDTSDSEAIYGEVDFALSEKLTLTTGARLQRETQERNFAITIGDETLSDPLNESETIFLPKLVMQYAASDATSLSLSARKGYNAPGGAFAFNNEAFYSYDEETVNTYEFGVRSHISGVNISGNVFYNSYDGYQALSSSRIIVNMDKATTYGAELEADIFLTANVQLSSSLGLLQTKIDDAGEQFADATGNELNSAPEISASLGLDYFISSEFSFGASVNYVGEYFGDINNSEERIAGDYTLANIKASYESERWTITGFVNNLFDELAITTREPALRGTPAYVGIVEPRSVGLSTTYKF